MIRFKTVAIPNHVADSVRETMLSPDYGHPAHADVATGYGPCRQCLRTFRVGEERRILFTYDPFSEVESYPLPGPVYIHETQCQRYPEDGGFPEELKAHPLTLNAYGRGRLLREQVRVEGNKVEAEVARLLSRGDVDYLHVRDTSAGCYDLRVEPIGGDAAGGTHGEVPRC